MSVADTEDNWKLIVNEIPVSQGSIATDMTYDAVSDKVYGCFHDANEFWKYNFATLDLETGTTQVIAPAEETYIVVAASNAGKIYAIGTSGKLYEINKETGEATLIGDTGVASDYLSSGCFDPATDKFYWNVSVESGYSGYDVFTYLYEVNTSDASLRKVCQPALNEQFTGMFIFPPKAEADAPDIPRNLKVDVEGEALTGVLGFDMPEVSYTGEPLSEELSWKALLNGEDLATGKAMPGEAVAVPFTITNSAQCVFEVTAGNQAGEGPIAKIEKWVGPDVPKAVENLKASKTGDEGSFRISWTLPEKAEHNTVIDPTRVTYKVVRMPGSITVADNCGETTVTDNIPLPENYTVYYYEVTPYMENNGGKTAVSNAVSLGSIIPPYKETFDTPFGLDVYTIINVNNDNTWTHIVREDTGEPCAHVRFEMTRKMDDWMITPPVRLEADRYYQFSFKASAAHSVWNEKVEAAWGESPQAAAMTDIIIGPTELEGTAFVTLTAKVRPTVTGDYYFGIHGISNANNFNLYVDDVEIIPGASLNAPASPVVEVKADPAGDLKATVTVTVPDKNIKGEPLNAVSRMEVYRGEELIKTIDAPAPGSAHTFTDDSPAEGMNTYSAVAENGNDRGETGTTEVYVGFDVPGVVQNIRISDTPSGKICIDWDEPVTGGHGGTIDASSLTYWIIREHDEELVALGMAERHFEDTPFTTDQQIERYFIIAQTDKGLGEGIFTDAIPAGAPYTLPFTESFANCGLTYPTWLTRRPEGSRGEWGIDYSCSSPAASPQDGDYGMAIFLPSKDGEEATMVGGKISLKGCVNPTLEFYYYFSPGNEILRVEAAADGGEFNAIHTIDFAGIEGNSGWKKATVALKDFNGAEFIRLAFAVTAATPARNLCIDNITVREALDYDLGIIAVATPSRLSAGDVTPVTATVVNFGDKAAENYNVQFYLNDELQATMPGIRILPGDSRAYTHTFVPAADSPAEAVWKVSVDYSADQNEFNNEKSAISFASGSGLPGVTGLTANVNAAGDVALTWNEADPEVTEAVTDSAEEYETFALTGIGDWLMVDVDRAYTYSFMTADDDLYDYPGVGMPMAFQILDPYKIGMPEEEAEGMKPHSGSQMFVAFGAVDTPNDDWMISPRLSGESQVISFFARSLNSYYGYESFEVYYSTTDTAIESFRKIDTIDGTDVPTEWTEYAAKLPQGAVYFAIRCISDDRFALLIDDITFIPEGAPTSVLDLKGYNVYRDSRLVNESPVTTASYTDTGCDSDTHVFSVTALYAEGESAGSDKVTVERSGTGLIEMPETVSIAGGKGTVTIECGADTDIAIYHPSGILVFSATAAGRTQISVSPGTYIVTADGLTKKVTVK